LLSACLAWLWPAPILPAGQQGAGAFAGWALIALAVALGVAAEIQFLLARTATLPTRPASALVTRGVYGFTRNPMYLAMSLALAGIGLAFNILRFVLALPVAVLAVTKLAIEREEVYLARRFGAPFHSYCAKTRRWV